VNDNQYREEREQQLMMQDEIIDIEADV